MTLRRIWPAGGDSGTGAQGVHDSCRYGEVLGDVRCFLGHCLRVDSDQGTMSASPDEMAQRLPGGRSLRDVDVLLTLIADVQDYAILMLDPEGRVASWNVGAQLLKGYSAEEIIGRHFSVFYPPDDIVAGKPKIGLEVAA